MSGLADLRLGFIPLTDCAPLIVAKEKGFFAQHGLDVTLVREPSWANMRDKVALGGLDAAHMLAPMPLAATLGAGGWKKPQVTSFVLNLNGNAVTISSRPSGRVTGGSARARQPTRSQSLQAGPTGVAKPCPGLPVAATGSAAP